MNRKDFFKNTSLLTLSSLLIPNFLVSKSNTELIKNTKKAKNIIFLVSDGMSTGTLSMTDIFLERKFGQKSNWLNLYRENKVKRSLMDTASFNSLVTDSAAGSSSWGGGARVPNGSLNVAENGQEFMPILQKFKQKGKKVGCVTTVPITHATPAGFCVNAKSRKGQEQIALKYLDLRFDVMMGGGLNFFSEERPDKINILQKFKDKNFDVFTEKSQIKSNKNNPILGVFYNDGLPYSIDKQQDENLLKKIPSLSEMTQIAIDSMKDNPNGFVLQVESGKVDWAAHGNDISALIHEQIEIDKSIKIAMDFAEKDKNTLVIITTDHGNANPGLIYGKNVNQNFDSIHKYKQSNDWILNGINNNFTINQVRERINYACEINISDQEAKEILAFYQDKNEEGIYNPRKLPFKKLAEIQSKTNSVGWISMDHSGDYVELAMFGPYSENLPSYIKNYELHEFMLNACQIENKF